MNEDKASPAVRYLIRAALAGAGAADSLGNVNSALLPNGACCFVIAEEAFYILNKLSSTGTVAGSSLAAMGGGTWFLQSVNTALAGGVEVLAGTSGGFPVDGSWGQTTSSVGAMTGTPPSWAYTALGSILTYSGPTRDFTVAIDASVRVGNADSPRIAFLGISKNNDLTGSPSIGTSNLNTTIPAVANDYFVGTVRRVTLASGDTLRPKMAFSTGSSVGQACFRMVVS